MVIIIIGLALLAVLITFIVCFFNARKIIDKAFNVKEILTENGKEINIQELILVQLVYKKAIDRNKIAAFCCK